jgi:hypothetical protein
MMVRISSEMQLSLVLIRDPRAKDTRCGVERSHRRQVWMVAKDADRPVFGTWFGLVRMDLGSGGRLPCANVVMLFVETLIPPLKAQEMNMMTGTITGQVLHGRVHSETLLVQVRRSIRPAVEILILLRMRSPTPANFRQNQWMRLGRSQCCLS